MPNPTCSKIAHPSFSLACRTLALCLLALVTAPVWAQNTVQVEAIEVKPQPLVEEVPLTGSVTANRISGLSTQVEGLVRDLHVDIGDRVEAGDLLLELDDELRRVDLARARAELAQAQEQWSESQRRLREAQTLAEGSIAASEIRGLEAQVRISEAERDAAQADLRRLEAELERHQVRAPFSGTISGKSTEEGEWVSPGTTMLELVSTEQLRADFQVPQRYYPQVDSGSDVRLNFDAYPDRTFTGKIHRKVPLSSDGARTFLLRVALPEEARNMLIPGMSSSGQLRVDNDNTGLAVPRDALIRYPDGRVTVWVVTEPEWGEESQVREQLVKTGMSFSGQVEIRSGLSEGDVVATRGNEALQEGQTVELRRSGSNDDNDKE